MNTGFHYSDPDSSLITLKSGMDLFSQDDQAGLMYVVLSGGVDIYRDRKLVMNLGPESVLGAEPLFILEDRYLYTARSSAISRFSSYQYSDLFDIFGTQPMIIKQILHSISRQLGSLWSGARAQDLSDLQFLGDIRTYGPGQWVIREGEDDTSLFRIVSAQKGLEVTKDGQKITVLRTPGDFFGEMAVVLGEKRTASVRSLGDAILEVYPGDQLQNILSDYPLVSMRIITALSKRLAETTRSLTVGD